MEFLNNIFQKPPFSRTYAPHMPDAPILSVEGISVQYETSSVLEDMSFTLSRGEKIAVVGPNGAGKTTLFKVIAGILDPVEGMVQVSGHEPHGHICISYVPQRSQVDWHFPVTVADVVMMGRVGKLGTFQWPKEDDWQKVRQALEIVGLDNLAKRQISELSGGQQQRMFIARSLAQEAELMLMDEPFTGLDAPSQESIFQVIERLKQKNVTLMVSMHDLKLAAERFDRIMLLNKRIVKFGAVEDVFTTESLTNAYGGHIHIIDGDMDTMAISDTCCGGGKDELD